MVAKIPLLISSRMMSAGLTPSSSASSLTVIVPGSSIAPRSRGSSVWTPAPLNAPSRRGGLRGPRRPRVPLLLLATGSSFDGRVHGFEAPGQRLAQVGRERGLERPAEGALGRWPVSRQSVVRQRYAPRPAARPVSSSRTSPVGRPHDAHEVTLRADRPTGDAGSSRDAPRGAGPRCPAYDATSPVATAAAFFAARLGLAAGAVGRRRPRRRRWP